MSWQGRPRVRRRREDGDGGEERGLISCGAKNVYMLRQQEVSEKVWDIREVASVRRSGLGWMRIAEFPRGACRGKKITWNIETRQKTKTDWTA